MSSSVQIVDPMEITSAAIPLHEQVALAFLLRYRNQLTARAYGRALRQWFGWCTSNNLDPLTVRRLHIEGWCRLLEQGGNAPATVAGKLNALVGFYRYAVAEEIISEALGIDIEHLGEHGPYPTVRIFRKGGKWEVQPLSYRSRYAVTQLIGDRTEGPLFLTRGGKRMMRQQAHRMVVRIGKKAGITKVISPHSLRHGFVTIALNAGIPTRDIRGATGHADDRMVAYYDRETLNLARSAVHSLEAFVAAVQ